MMQLKFPEYVTIYIIHGQRRTLPMYTGFHSPTQLLDDDAAVGAGADVKKTYQNTIIREAKV